jgi:hypothetical protein
MAVWLLARKSSAFVFCVLNLVFSSFIYSGVSTYLSVREKCILQTCSLLVLGYHLGRNLNQIGSLAERRRGALEQSESRSSVRNFGIVVPTDEDGQLVETCQGHVNVSSGGDGHLSGNLLGVSTGGFIL